MKPTIHKGKLNAASFRFAIIESGWNEPITSKLTLGALSALEALGAEETNIEIFKVPGSFELPLGAKKAAESGVFDAIICVGVIIRGETPHFDIVAGEAAKGISRVALDTGVPVIFCVLTTENVEQAMNRAGIKHGNKGYESGLAAVELANLYQEMGNERLASAETKAMSRVV
ncbi:MAG: 6,7-dimethyl-8-ribityllumazine synthase [Pyrinomonadaceae bacterium]